MKNFLYKFEFISSTYENIFFKQINAKDEKDAIIQIVAEFKNVTFDEAKKYLDNDLCVGSNVENAENSITSEWMAADFWGKMDRKFFSQDLQEAYFLYDVRNINFDLNLL